MSFLHEAEQQLLAVSDIGPPARRRVEQLREMPGVRHGVSRFGRRHETKCSTSESEVRHLLGEPAHLQPRSRCTCQVCVHQAGTSVHLQGSGQPPAPYPVDAGNSRPDDPSHQRDFGREVGAHTRDRALTPASKTCELQAKPSVGLEPTTPSLPWNHAGPKESRLAGRSCRDLLAEIRPNCGRLAGPCSPGVPRLLSLCGSDFSFWRKRLDQAMAASGGGAYIVLHDA
jgi:hypothetical protein